MIKILEHGTSWNKSKERQRKPKTVTCYKWISLDEIKDNLLDIPKDVKENDGMAIGCDCYFSATADEFFDREQLPIGMDQKDRAKIVCPECGIIIPVLIPHTDEYIQGEEND